MPPKESPTPNGGVIASLVKCCSAKFSHTVCVQIMIFSASFLDCLFAFLENLRASEYNLLLLSSMRSPPLACSELAFCPFLPCFRFEYVYLYALCAYMYSCMLMCVFPLEWNISCCIYAIYCTFYRTYVLALQYLALYGIICLQLNSGYVKIALICPHTIPFWYFFRF